MDTIEPIPATLSDRDNARVTITARLIAAVMTGHMARQKNVEDALSAAEADRESCLAAAGSLYDANTQDFGQEFARERLSAATELMAAAVSGLVSRGESGQAAIRQASRSREHMLRHAQGTIRAAATPPSAQAQPLSATLEAFRGNRGTVRTPGSGGAPVL